MKKMGLLLVLLGMGLALHGQQYTGMSGLIHVPTGEMDKEGDARVGVHFLNREFSPTNFAYNTTTHYLSITPFSWVEVGYTCTLMKGNIEVDGVSKDGGYSHKDRYFSLKLQPLKEGRWWPSVAVGANDFYGTGDKDELTEEQLARGSDGNSQYFCNYFVAASKHLHVKRHELGVHLAYRHFKRPYNAKWNGVVGGITFRPAFFPKLRAVAEYTGDDVNIGADCLLLKYFLLQATLQNGKYFSGGICLQVNLF